MADNSFKIVARLDVPASVGAIINDIPKLEKTLRANKEGNVKIVAGLDTDKSAKFIQSQLNTLINQANAPTIKVGIDVGQNNAVQGITNGLKEIQTQAQATVKSVSDIITVLNPNQISDSAVQKFQKALGITGKQAQQTTSIFKQLMSQLHNAWYADDINAYNTALDAVHTQIVQNYESTKTYKQQVQELSSIYRSVLTDGSKVFIDSNLRKELEYNIQNAKQLKSVLDTVYGVGKWSYKTGVPADALFKNDNEYMSAQAILDVYKQISAVKSEAALNSRPEDYNTQIKGLLNLKTAYIDANGMQKEYIEGLGWYESVSDNVVQDINEEITAVKESTHAYKDKLKAIRETTEYDAWGQRTGRTSVYGDTGFRKTSKYDENDDLTSYTITENYEALAKSMDKAEAKATKLEQRLMSVYESANRGSKPVQDQNHWIELARQAEKAQIAIDKIHQADSRTSASIEATANAEIAKLQDLVRQYQNAEYAAESLRTKDVNTVKNIQTQELDKFINKINGSKVSLDTMTTDVNELRTALANVGDKDSLTKFLNQFDIAKAKFESLKTLYQSIGGYDKQLDNLAKSWEKQGIYAGNLKTTIEGLKSSLANVKTADGLTSWIGDFNTQIGAISQLPVKIAEYRNQLSTVKTEWDKQHTYVQSVYNAFGKLGSRLGSIKTEAGFDKWVKDFDSLVIQSNNLKTNLDSQVSTQNRIYEIQSKIANLNPNKDINKIANLNNELQLEQQTLSNLQYQANVYTKLVSYEEQEKYITEQTVKARQQLNNAMAGQADKAIQQRTADMKSYQKQIETAISSLTTLNNSTVFSNNSSNPQVTQTKQEISNLITEYQKLYAQLQANPTSQGLETLRTKLTELDNRMKTAVNSAKAFEKQLRSDNSADQLRKKVELLTRQMKAYQVTNTKAAKAYKQQFSDMFAILSNPNIDNQAFTTVQKQFQALRQEAIATGKVGKTMFQTIGDAVKKFAGWMSMTYLVSSFARSLRDMVNNVIELDTAMTNLKKVTDETEATYSKFLKNTSKQAKELHSTITDLVEQVATWSKLGYSLSQAEHLAKISMIYSKVGEVDNATSVSDLVTVMKAFNIESEKSIHIVDSLNQLGKFIAPIYSNVY